MFLGCSISYVDVLRGADTLFISVEYISTDYPIYFIFEYQSENGDRIVNYTESSDICLNQLSPDQQFNISVTISSNYCEETHFLSTRTGNSALRAVHKRRRSQGGGGLSSADIFRTRGVL